MFHVRRTQSQNVKYFCMWQQSFYSYRSTFLSSRAWWSLRARTSRKTCRSGWACRTTLTRRTLHPHHSAMLEIRQQSYNSKKNKTKGISGTSTRPNRSDLVLYKERTVHIIILCKSLEQLRVGTFAMKTIPRDGGRILKVWARERGWQIEDADAVSCTHSGTRWAVRTLIPFQAVSPLQKQNKREGFRKQTHLLGKHTSCLALDCLSSNRAQREMENLLQSPKWKLKADGGKKSYLSKTSASILYITKGKRGVASFLHPRAKQKAVAAIDFPD